MLASENDENNHPSFAYDNDGSRKAKNSLDINENSDMIC